MRAKFREKQRELQEKGNLTRVVLVYQQFLLYGFCYMLLIVTFHFMMCKAVWVLMYWKEEESTSVHPENEIIGSVKEPGATCEVRFGRTSVYSGKIAAMGNRHNKQFYNLLGRDTIYLWLKQYNTEHCTALSKGR